MWSFRSSLTVGMFVVALSVLGSSAAQATPSAAAMIEEGERDVARLQGLLKQEIADYTHQDAAKLTDKDVRAFIRQMDKDGAFKSDDELLAAANKELTRRIPKATRACIAMPNGIPRCQMKPTIDRKFFASAAADPSNGKLILNPTRKYKPLTKYNLSSTISHEVSPGHALFYDATTAFGEPNAYDKVSSTLAEGWAVLAQYRRYELKGGAKAGGLTRKERIAYVHDMLTNALMQVADYKVSTKQLTPAKAKSYFIKNGYVEKAAAKEVIGILTSKNLPPHYLSAYNHGLNQMLKLRKDLKTIVPQATKSQLSFGILTGMPAKTFREIGRKAVATVPPGMTVRKDVPAYKYYTGKRR